MQSAMMKIVGSEQGLVTLVYDILNTGEAVATNRRGEIKEDKDAFTPPFRTDHFNRLASIFLESR